MIKAYIADINGTFVQSEYLSNKLHERWNVPIEESLQALKGIQDIIRFPKAPKAFSLWKPYLERWQIDITEKDFFDWWFSFELLQKAVVSFCVKVRNEGKKVYILSNNFKERTVYYKKQFPEIFQNIDGSYFSCENGFVKPNVEAIQNVLNDNQLKPDEVIYVDDSLQNLESARSLGIRAYSSFSEIEEA